MPLLMDELLGDFRAARIRIERTNQHYFEELLLNGCSRYDTYMQLKPSSWTFEYMLGQTSIISYALERCPQKSMDMVLKYEWYTTPHLCKLLVNIDLPSKLDRIISHPTMDRVMKRINMLLYDIIYIYAEKKQCALVNMMVQRFPEIIYGDPPISLANHINKLYSCCEHCVCLLHPFLRDGVTKSEIDDKYYSNINAIKVFMLEHIIYEWKNWLDIKFKKLVVEYFKGKFTRKEIARMMYYGRDLMKELLIKYGVVLSGQELFLEIYDKERSNNTMEKGLADTMIKYGLHMNISDLCKHLKRKAGTFLKKYESCVTIDIENISPQNIEIVPELIKMVPMEMVRPLLPALLSKSAGGNSFVSNWLIEQHPKEILYNTRITNMVLKKRNKDGYWQLIKQYKRCIVYILLIARMRGDNLISYLDRQLIQNIIKWI